MSELELKRFIEKVSQLEAMVDSLENVPGRRSRLAECKNHDEVIKLARSWGYEIGRRWGED